VCACARLLPREASVSIRPRTAAPGLTRDREDLRPDRTTPVPASALIALTIIAASWLAFVVLLRDLGDDAEPSARAARRAAGHAGDPARMATPPADKLPSDDRLPEDVNAGSACLARLPAVPPNGAAKPAHLAAPATPSWRRHDQRHRTRPD
jgi:hypothetical protein